MICLEIHQTLIQHNAGKVSALHHSAWSPRELDKYHSILIDKFIDMRSEELLPLR